MRELENTISRLSLRARGGRITAELIESDPDLARTFSRLISQAPVNSLRELERNQIERALAQTAGNKHKAAKLLGISKATIFRKLKGHQVTNG